MERPKFLGALFYLGQDEMVEAFWISPPLLFNPEACNDC